MNEIVIDSNGQRMLTPTQYAEHRGTTMRTVKRWISEGRLPEAVKGEDGRWSIPADAIERKGHAQPALMDAAALVPTRATSREVVDAAHGIGTHREVTARRRDETPAELLDTLPALVDVDQAARVAGVPESAVRTLVRQEHLDGVLIGSAHRLYVTQASLRRLMGR